MSNITPFIDTSVKVNNNVLLLNGTDTDVIVKTINNIEYIDIAYNNTFIRNLYLPASLSNIILTITNYTTIDSLTIVSIYLPKTLDGQTWSYDISTPESVLKPQNSCFIRYSSNYFPVIPILSDNTPPPPIPEPVLTTQYVGFITKKFTFDTQTNKQPISTGGANVYPSEANDISISGVKLTYNAVVYPDISTTYLVSISEFNIKFDSSCALIGKKFISCELYATSASTVGGTNSSKYRTNVVCTLANILNLVAGSTITTSTLLIFNVGVYQYMIDTATSSSKVLVFGLGLSIYATSPYDVVNMYAIIKYK
jgi:hypothetical protein